MLVGRSGWYARSLAGHASKTRCTRFDGGIGLAASGRFNRPLQAQSIHRLARDMANQAQPQRKSLFGHSGIGPDLDGRASAQTRLFANQSGVFSAPRAAA